MGKTMSMMGSFSGCAAALCVVFATIGSANAAETVIVPQATSSYSFSRHFSDGTGVSGEGPGYGEAWTEREGRRSGTTTDYGPFTQPSMSAYADVFAAPGEGVDSFVGSATVRWYFAVIGPDGAVPIQLVGSGGFAIPDFDTTSLAEDYAASSSLILAGTETIADRRLSFSRGSVGDYTHTSDGFTSKYDERGIYVLQTNTVYSLTMMVSLQTMANGAFGGGGGHASIYIDPYVRLPGDFLEREKYSFAVSEGVGNGPIPEPATWAFMIIGMGSAGVALRRQRALGVRATGETRGEGFRFSIPQRLAYRARPILRAVTGA